MTPTLNELRTKLREAAKLATQGEWTFEPRNVKFYNGEHTLVENLHEVILENGRDWFLGADIPQLESPSRSSFIAEDAYWIFLTQPKNVLQILEALDAAEERGFRASLSAIKHSDACNIPGSVPDYCDYLEEQLKKSP